MPVGAKKKKRNSPAIADQDFAQPAGQLLLSMIMPAHLPLSIPFF